MITAFWFYFIAAKLNYPKISLKLSENKKFPKALLKLIHQPQEEIEQESLYSLIFILPTLSDMYILHAVKRVLEIKRRENTTFSWHIILTEKPSETPLLRDIEEQAKMSIVQDDDLSKALFGTKNGSFSKTNKPLFFILSPENKILWILNPRSTIELMMFDSKVAHSISNYLWYN